MQLLKANTILIGLPLNVALFGNRRLLYFLIYYITNTISTWTLKRVFGGGEINRVKSKEETSKFDWKKYTSSACRFSY